VAAKTSVARLESELKQEKGSAQDTAKMLLEERNVMSTMDMEHQQQLVDLEQSHQEKVSTTAATAASSSTSTSTISHCSYIRGDSVERCIDTYLQM